MSGDGSEIGIPEEFMVFRTRYPLTSTLNNFVLWNENDRQKFMEIARKMQSSRIYLYLDEGNEMDEPSPKIIEMGFEASGIFHIMSEGGRKQSQEQGQTDNSPTPATGNHLLSMKVEEISSELVQFVRSNLDYMSPDSFNLQYFFKKFWQSHGIDVDFLPGTEERKIMNQAERLASEKLKK